MIKEFERVVSKVEKLSREKQLEIVHLIEEELNWEESISKTQDQLSALAEEALENYKNGKVSDKDW